MAAGVVASVAALMAAPSAFAGASQVGVNGTVLTLSAPAGEGIDAYITSTTDDQGHDVLRVSISGSGNTATAGNGCQAAYGGSSTTVDCRTVAGGPNGGFTRMTFTGNPCRCDDKFLISNTPVPATLSGGDGKDQFTSFDGSNGIDIFDGGPGDDQLAGGDGVDHISGGTGNDNQVRGDDGDDVVDGGPGTDYVLGDAGNDQVTGGPGHDDLRGDDLYPNRDTDGNDDIDGGDNDDTIAGNFGDDTIVGGSGIDTATYEQRHTDGDGTGLFVALDGNANDGEVDQDGSSIEADNVGPDGSIENVTGPYNAAEVPMSDDLNASVVLIGNDGPNVLDEKSFDGAVLLDGAGGDDTLRNNWGDDGSVLFGGDGDDELDGSSAKDIMDGEAGSDTLNGSSGADDLTGGPGIDDVNGDSGNDTLRTQDSAGGDRANCDLGADVAIIDYNDVTDELCEAVSSTSAPTPPAPDNGGGGGGNPAGGNPVGNGGTTNAGGNGGGLPTVPVMDAALKKAEAVKAFLRGFPVTADRAGTFTTQVLANTKDAKRLHLAGSKTVKLATGKVVLAGPGFATLRPKFTKKAKRRIKKVKHLKVTVITTFTPTVGQKTITRDVITLKK